MVTAQPASATPNPLNQSWGLTVEIRIFDSKDELGERAAAMAGGIISAAQRERGVARIIAATGASQFDFLSSLTNMRGIDWKRVTMFHLDEYVGLPDTHPASFRRYLHERLIDKAGITDYCLLNPEGDPAAECRRVGELICKARIDVAFVGIGENGHLAFNDPPADFDTVEPYLVVNLDLRCRRQQLGEGWFRTLEEVPVQAISMSIHQILQSRSILCIVPEKRKAEAVKSTLEGPVSAMVPASVLKTHAATTMFLDRESSSLLANRKIQ